MRKLINIASVLALSILMTGTAYAQAKIKIVDSSAKRVPTWVNSSQSDYIITSAINEDIEVAKSQCLDNVRKAIIEAVAENVKSTTTGAIDQKVINNEIVSFLDTFSSTYETQAAPIPVLKGISASRIEAYYWEKQLNKSSGKSTYVYSIKYPFPSIELKKMIREFEVRDREIYGVYLTLAEQVDKIESVEQIDRAITDLGPVIKYLFDDTRKNAAKSLQTKHQALYNNITFRTISNELGEHKFALMLHGKEITTSQRLTLKSDFATELTANQKEGVITVGYKYDYCEPAEENSVAVNFRFGSKTVPHKFFFTIKKFQVEIWPEGTVYLTAAEKVDSTSMVGNIAVRLNVKSGYKGDYVVKSLLLDVPGLSEPLFMDNLNDRQVNKEATVSVTWIGNTTIIKAQNYRQNMLKGEIYVEVPDEGINKRITFSLPFKCNW